MLSLPKVFYTLHFKDGKEKTIAVDNEIDRVRLQKNPTIVGGLDTIVSLDTSSIARVEIVDPRDKSADTSQAYVEKMTGPIKAVGELRLEKYNITHGKNMPLLAFKKRMNSFIGNWKQWEEEGDKIYSKCYRDNGGQ